MGPCIPCVNLVILFNAQGSTINGGTVGLCLLCGQGKREVVLLPCGHVGTCDKCEVTVCPLCKESVTGKNKASVIGQTL